ncbi:MAG: transketolase [Myxococcota bacterium]
MDANLHRRCANTIAGLAMDAVQTANSGHPGMPMGMADAATVLWTRFLKFDPADPTWFDRDRFVLSAGHGSMLLYSLLHLAGYDLPLQELKDFRKWGSRTPGHPEVHHTPGVETTTGPLGQGFANGIGMAFAERTLRETFGTELCDHWTYAIVSDGDLMEGVAYEAASLAGHLGLGRLVYLWDDNRITIDGGTDLAFSEDVLARMVACGWHVQRVDGHDPEAVAGAIEAARAMDTRPSIIACRTVIGKGSPSYEGTSRTHGAALGVEEVAATKAALGMDPEAQFAVPDDVVAAFRSHEGASARAAWQQRHAGHARGAELDAWLAGATDEALASVEWPRFEAGTKLATRKASLKCLNAVVKAAPWLIGGSADLAGSNGTKTGQPPFTSAGFSGAGTVHFGIREHAMGSICNGITLHGGLRPYNATFLAFHDYQRPAVRMSALMQLPVVYIYTHDSIFLGEDGPTHQPIATLLALRALPNSSVWRPADAAETAIAWRETLRHTTGPSSLILTRQGLPVVDRSTHGDAEGAARGGYVLSDANNARICLLGTGSEVATCIEAQALLAERGIASRVVSLPNRERFLTQDEAYQRSVLPVGIPRVAVEAAVSLGWERWTGDGGAIIGVDTYGASAPGAVLAQKFGFTAENIAATAERLLG